jgi:hypothetical protein
MRERHWFGLIAVILFAAAAYVTMAAAANESRSHGQGSGKHAVFPLPDGAWHDFPPGLPAGSRFAVISGDPSGTAPFVMRVELPPGYAVAPYRRANEESIVVLAGVLELGNGDTFDEQSMRALPSGSFVQLPANQPHFLTTREGATVQIVSTGPFTIEYMGTSG